MFNIGDFVCLYFDKDKEVFIVENIINKDQIFLTVISSIDRRKLEGAKWLFINPPEDTPTKYLQKAKNIKLNG